MWLGLLLNNYKTICYITAILAVFGSGWYVRGGICETSRLTLENGYKQATLDAEARYNEIAAQLEVTKAEKQKTKTIIRERISNAKDSSFGCHVNPDGVRIINDARNSHDTSKSDK